MSCNRPSSISGVGHLTLLSVHRSIARKLRGTSATLQLMKEAKAVTLACTDPVSRSTEVASGAGRASATQSLLRVKRVARKIVLSRLFLSIRSGLSCFHRSNVVSVRALSAQSVDGV